MPQTPEEKREKARWSRILRVYGLTKEQYDELDLGHCPICIRTWNSDLVPCIDHDHSTGQIRGLACRYCNRYVIGRHRDSDLITRLAEYLKGPFKGWIVPKPKKKKKKSTKKK